MGTPERLYAADLSSLQQFDADPFTVHTDWSGVLQRLGQSTSKIEMMRMVFGSPNIEFTSRMSSTPMGARWTTESSAQLGSGLQTPTNNEYFSALNEQIKPYNLGMLGTLFNNVRLIHNDERILTLVSLHPDVVQIYNSGERTFTGVKYKGISQKLVAPKFEEVKNHYDFFKQTLQVQLLAVNALAECVTGRNINTQHDFLLTGHEGTYIYDEERGVGERALERIVLVDEHLPMNEPQEEMKQPSGDVFAESLDDGDYKVMIEDVIGSAQMHNQLRQVVKAFKHPDAMKKWGVNMSQGVLLYGPPGTGKTMAAQALANELGGDLWEVQVNEIKGKWVGDSEKNIQSLFDDAAKKTVPTVMLWDEIDSIIGRDEDGGGGGSQVMEAVRGIFKRESSRLAERAPNVILVGSTNHMDRIDDAILRAGRFDTKIYMDLPNDDGRAQLLSSKIAAIVSEYGATDHLLYSPDINVRKLSQMTEEWSGAELVEILIRAQRKKAFEEAEGASPAPISQQDLEIEISAYRFERQ